MNQEREAVDVKYVSIREVLNDPQYEISHATFRKYYEDVVGKRFQVYPRVVTIDRRIPTTVVWRNDTSEPIPLKHDMIEETKESGFAIPVDDSFSHTFEPKCHPPGTLYYTVHPNNQPGETSGRPRNI